MFAKILQWIKSTRSEWCVNLFFRESGCICYEIPAILEDTLPQLLLKMTSDQTQWWWNSERAEPASLLSPVRNLPDARSLTMLKPENCTEFVDDFKELSDDGEGRYIFAYLIDVSRMDTTLIDSLVTQWLEVFARSEAGPISAVLVRLNDSPYFYVYTTHNPSENIQMMLQELGLGEASTVKRRPYKALGTAQLETLFGLRRGKKGARLR